MLLPKETFHLQLRLCSVCFPQAHRRLSLQLMRLCAVLAIFIGEFYLTQGSQRGFSHGKRQVAMHADGFLEGSNTQRRSSEDNDQVEDMHDWDSIPSCAREFFSQYKPSPANEHGMRELLPGIDAFYVIHDDARFKRRSRLENILHPSRLDQLATWVTWFSEENIQSIPHQSMACVFNQSYAEPLFLESISAPLSRNLKHLWVYHEILRRGLHSALVMEDNPVFRDDVEYMTGRLQELVGSLPSDHPVVMLGDTDVAQGHAWRAAEIERSFKASHANQKVSEHLYAGLGHRGASGYLITAGKAAAILQYVYGGFKADAEADALMENALGPESFYWYEPPLWVQSESPIMVELGHTATNHDHVDDDRADDADALNPGPSHFSAEDEGDVSTTSAPSPPEDYHRPLPEPDTGHPENENVTNHRWSIFHRYMGTSGDDDPYRGARERHPDVDPDGNTHPPV